ncbi:MAG: response regulator [Bacillota bacterium]
MNKKRLLLVDDHPLFRRGLAELLNSQDEFIVVGEAGDGLEALEQARQLEPDLVLMDLVMPGCSGMEALKRIKQELPQIKVIILTVHEENESVLDALRNGAEGYLFKSMNFDGFARCLKGVFDGELAMPRSLAHKVIKEVFQIRGSGKKTASGSSSKDKLSQREIEVMKLVVQGLSNREIGNQMVISESTVKNHLHNILKKLNLSNRVQLVHYALQEGMPGKEKTP